MKKFDTSGSSRRLRRAFATAWWALSAATLVACGGGGGGGAPAPAPVAPTPTPVNQGPTPARLVEVSSSAVGALSVSWLPATDDTTAPAALRYQVHASTDAAFVPSATTLRAATTGSTSATISAGLVPGTRYTVKVVAVDSQDATSAASAALDAVVSDTVATPAPGVTTQSLAAAQVATVTANSVVLAAGAAVPAPGTVIASSEANGGAGFLRRVTGTSTAAGVTTVNTSPVGLAQVMQQVRVSSTYRLDTVPAEVAQAAAALDRRSMQRLADGSQRQSFNWPETGLSYGTDAGANVQRRTVLAARQPSALGGVATAGFKSSGGATVNEEYGQMAGQTRVEVNEGQSGQDTWTVDITSNDKPLLPLFLSSKVGICKVEVGPVRYSGDDGKPALVKVTATNFQAVETRDGNRITRATQAIKFEALAGASAEKPYRVKITASLDDVDDNCQGSAREQVHIEVLITVTKDSFPTQEAAEETYSGSAGYSIVNRVVTSFSPKLVFDQDISLGRLQSARISVSASPMVEQTLTLTATAQGTVDATKIIVKPRTFRKVYVTPAGIPIVISGEFRIDLRIQGNVSGALNATEVLNIGYEEVSFGVEYRNGEFVPVKSATPVYSLKIAGDGKAEADLTLTLLPRLELRAWEALTGVAVLAPALKAEAGVEGLVRLDAVVDFENDAQLVTATDADYRLTKASLFAGLKSYVYADLSIWDERLLVYPNESAKKGDYNTFEPFEMLAWTELMGLPTLSAFMPEGEGAIHPTDTRLLKVRGQAADVTNPLFTLFPTVLPESFMPWTRWTAAKIVQQLAVPPASYARVADPGGDSAVAWLRFMQPGTYTVRLGGHSKLGSWARQYVELEVAVFDDNANGIMDWWERRYALQGDGGAAIAQADPDGDGATNLQEWLAGTDPNTPQPPPGRLMADPATASVLQSIRFWVLDAVQAVASVVWNFGAGLAEQVAAVSNGVSAAVSQAYDSTGVKTVVATFKDAVGAVLGIRSTQVTVVTPGPVVTDVSPLLATAGTPRSFTVTGRELPDGLRFQLLGCANPVEAPGGNSARREFSCTFPVNTPAGNYDGTVALSDNPFGAPPPYTFTVTVGVPVVGAVQPAGATRTLSTSFEIAGQGLPTSGITVVPVGDSRSTCQAPNNLAASGFGVACELFKVGAQALEVRQGTDVLGRVTVNVASNVTGVTWASPSTTSSGTVLFGETVTYKVAGTNLLADTTMGFAVERCGVSNTEIGVPSNTERTFTCLFNNEAGAVAGQMPGVVKDAPGGQVLLEGWNVPVEVPPVVPPPPVVPTTLLAHHAFDGTLTDAVRTGLAGQLTAVGVAAQYEAGRNNQAVVLTPNSSASSSYLRGGPLVTTDTAFSISAWVKPNVISTSGFAALVYQRTDGGVSAPGCTGNAYNFGLTIYRGQWVFQVATLDGANCVHGEITAAGHAVTGRYQHVAAVYDQAARKILLYADGVLMGQKTVGPNLRLTPNMVTTIGNQPWAQPTQPANATLDELKVFSGALSAAEVAVLAGGAASPTAASPRKLNDTGLRRCLRPNAALTQLEETTDCNQAGLGYPEPAAPQDAQFGLDVMQAGVTDGVAGFSFTKLDNRGLVTTLDKLAGDAPDQWGCTRDNNTGLVWEAKQRGHATRDPATTFRRLASTLGPTADDYVQQINQLALCGYSDWRLPTIWELHSLMDYGTSPVRLADGRAFTMSESPILLMSSTQRKRQNASSYFLGFKVAGISSTSDGSGGTFSTNTVGQLLLVRGAPIVYEGVRDFQRGVDVFQTWGITARTSCTMPGIWNAITQECDFAETAYVTNAYSVNIIAQREFDRTGIRWRAPNIKELMLLMDFENSAGRTDGTCVSDPGADSGVSSTHVAGSPNSTWVVSCDGVRSTSGFNVGYVWLIATP